MQSQLAHYEIKELLGKGTFAEVYRAFDQKLERDVALKVLKPVWASDPQAIRRFKREAKTIARLRHPHIIDVYDVGEAEGHVYLAQLLVEGDTLAARLRQGALTWPDMLAVLQPLASALDEAHAQGIVHRDLKPSNILLDRSGKAFLGDFGLGWAAEGSTALMSTSTAGMIGTPAYMAPEQWEGQPATAATDVYALSCLVVEMLTGQVLFDGSTPPVVMKQHLIEGPKFPAEWPTGIPTGVTEVLRRGLAQDPAERISSARKLAAALAELMTSPRSVSPPAGTRSRASSKPVVPQIETWKDRTTPTAPQPPLSPGPVLSPTPRQSVQRRAPWGPLLNGNFVVAAVLVLLILVGTIFVPSFYDLRNISNVLRFSAVSGIVSLGMLVVILTAGIDLSVGSLVAITGVLAVGLQEQVPLPLALLAAIAAGLTAGALNGVFVAKRNVPPYIATLGMMAIARGLAYVYTGGTPIQVTDTDTYRVFRDDIGSFPVGVLIWLVLAVITMIMLKWTKFGHTIVSIGSNQRAVYLTGINVDWYLIAVYTFSGLMCALGGILLTSYLNIGQPTLGQGMELNAIAAVVIGGASLAGGRGTVWGTIIGVLILGLISNILTLMGVSSYFQLIIPGLILLLAVAFKANKKSE